MRRFVAFVFFGVLLNCNFALSQLKFFIEPTYNAKIGFAFLDPNDNQSGVKNPFQNQKIYYPLVVSESARIIQNFSLNIGLCGGFFFNDDKNKIKFEWSQDKASFRTHSNHRPYFGDYSATGIIYHYYMNRFNVNVSQKISQKNGFMSSWLSLGVGSFVNINKFGGIGANWNYENLYLLLTTELRSVYIESPPQKRINAFLRFGFENDFKFHNKYLLSFRIDYIQGLTKVAHVVYGHEYLINNETIHYRSKLWSRGSGIYFQLSRRFQVYPVKKKVKLDK